MLQKEKDFTPRFSIDTRLGRKERVAVIAVDPDDNTLQLNFGGTDNNLFRLSQCAIYLRINSIRIISISADFLLTRETGLPHAQDRYIRQECRRASSATIRCPAPILCRRTGAHSPDSAASC